MTTRKIVTVVGARPQLIKAAVISRQLAQHRILHEVMVHTGQHFDAEMSDVFFSELGIRAPAHDLDIHGGNHGEMTGRMLEAIEQVLMDERPEIVMVYGDTNSTLAGALAAAKLHIPVAHIEAGLRSFNRRMPEEVNRVLTDHVSELLFCPTRTAEVNLRNEGIFQGIYNVGDVMYDAVLFAAREESGRRSVLERLGLRGGGYSVATVHRAENTDDAEGLRRVLEFLAEQSREVPVVFPLHPRTRAAVERFGLSLGSLLVVPPLGYIDMAHLVRRASTVYTDSGGLQKESYFYRVPCVTLRSETEWVETVEAGWNRLWHEPDYRPRRDIDEYGDGQAGEKIVNLLAHYLHEVS